MNMKDINCKRLINARKWLASFTRTCKYLVFTVMSPHKLSMTDLYIEIFFQVLQRKTEEAAMATKRLKELLEARKSNRDNTLTSNGNGANVQVNIETNKFFVSSDIFVLL